MTLTLPAFVKEDAAPTAPSAQDAAQDSVGSEKSSKEVPFEGLREVVRIERGELKLHLDEESGTVSFVRDPSQGLNEVRFM